MHPVVIECCAATVAQVFVPKFATDQGNSRHAWCGVKRAVAEDALEVSSNRKPSVGDDDADDDAQCGATAVTRLCLGASRSRSPNDLMRDGYRNHRELNRPTHA